MIAPPRITARCVTVADAVALCGFAALIGYALRALGVG